MIKITSKYIVREIVRQIFSGELKPDQKLLSENQIVIKYKVSRTMATKAYSTLKSIGAIYSVPKKGFFIAKHFSGIIRSLEDEYRIDFVEDSEWKPDKKFLKNLELGNNYYYFTRKYFKNKELIAISWNCLNKDIVYKNDIDLFNNIIWGNQLVSAVNLFKFKELEAFGNKNNLVNTKIHYGVNKISYVQNIVVNPDFFELSKKEWPI